MRERQYFNKQALDYFDEVARRQERAAMAAASQAYSRSAPSQPFVSFSGRRG